jgi:SLAP domain-containing protein
VPFLDTWNEKTFIAEETEVQAEELEIFGRSKTREEIKTEEKARKKAELEALREAHRQAKAAKKAAPKELRKDLLVMGLITLVILVGIGVALGVNIGRTNKAYSYEMSEDTPGYFYDNEATPELKKDGITAAVNEAYYTNGGHLCVKMTLGNGADKAMSLDSLEVKISDDKETLIASGYTENIDVDYTVPADGTNDYTFYIKPEHVKIADATLETISYEITAVGTLMEE